MSSQLRLRASNDFSLQQRMQQLFAILKLREVEDTLFSYMTLDEFRHRLVLGTALEEDTRHLQLLQDRRLEQQQIDNKRREIERQRVGFQVGDKVKGEVFEVASDGSIWFTPIDPPDRMEYEARFVEVKSPRAIGDTVKGIVLERHDRGANLVQLICEQVLKEKK